MDWMLGLVAAAVVAVGVVVWRSWRGGSAAEPGAPDATGQRGGGRAEE